MIPESLRIELGYEIVDPSVAAPTPQATGIDKVIRDLAHARQWSVSGSDGKWIVESGSTATSRRILIERAGTGTSAILRFTRQGDVANPAQYAEMLRQNGRIAYAGFGIAGEPRHVVMTASLLEHTADPEEIEAVMSSIVSAGEPVGQAATMEFERGGYKLAAASGVSWEDELLRKALAGSGIGYERTGARANMLVRLEGGRTQRVHALFDRVDRAGHQLIQMLSICGPATAEYHAMALSSNPTLAHAMIALATIGNEENLVVVRTQLASTADPEEILGAVMTLAKVGDSIEKRISGGQDQR